MGNWWDVVDDIGGAVISGGARMAEHVPGVGSALSAQQAARHTGMALYDGATGDRDGAINHGTQALYNGANANPAFNAMTSLGDAILGGSSIVDHAVGAATGEETVGIPGGLGEVFGQTAVGLTRGIFGEDDSNWIADGSTPTGTHQGESMAGYSAANAIAGPVPAAMGALYGYGRSQFDGDPNGPTSGVGSQGRLADAVEHWTR